MTICASVDSFLEFVCPMATSSKGHPIKKSSMFVEPRDFDVYQLYFVVGNRYCHDEV